MNKNFLRIPLLAILLFWAASGVAQDYFYSSEMSLEKYNHELETWQARTVQLEQQKQQLRQEIKALKEEIAEVKEQITRTRHETLLLLSDIVSYPDKLDKNKDDSNPGLPLKTGYQNRSF